MRSVPSWMRRRARSLRARQPSRRAACFRSIRPRRRGLRSSMRRRPSLTISARRRRPSLTAIRRSSMRRVRSSTAPAGRYARAKRSSARDSSSSTMRSRRSKRGFRITTPPLSKASSRFLTPKSSWRTRSRRSTTRRRRSMSSSPLRCMCWGAIPMWAISASRAIRRSFRAFPRCSRCFSCWWRRWSA